MYKKVETDNVAETVRFCYSQDPTVEHTSIYDGGLEGVIEADINYLKTADKSFMFYKIVNEDDQLVGYFGTEDVPFSCLTTFFMLPQFRKEKAEIFMFIKSQLPKPFYAGLFKANERAVKFFQKQGGVIIDQAVNENHPGYIFEFRG